MGNRRFGSVSLVVIIFASCLLLKLLSTSEYKFLPSLNLLISPIPLSTIPYEPASLLSNRLSSSNASDWQASVPMHDLPENDNAILLNITDFNFLINAPCSKSIYIVCVCSAPENEIKRQHIRKSWGAYVTVYFMLAETSPEIQMNIDAESNTYHDIVQGKFKDSYLNLTYKHTMVFKWVIYNCPHVKYVLKVDDDVFINVQTLDEYIKQRLSPYGTQNLLMCPEVWYYERTQRSYRSKWRVSFKDYSRRYYPPHCRGAAMLYSPDLMFQLYQVLQREKTYFWVEDVFVTGMMFEKLNMTHSKFGWLQERGTSLLKVFSEYDVKYYNPRKHLFVLLQRISDNQKFVNIFEELRIKTFTQSDLL